MQKNTKAKTMLPDVDADKNGGVPISEGEVRIELSTLRENPDNPQTVTDEEFAKLRDSMRRIHAFLRTRPLLVEADGTIKCGNKRYRALLANGVRVVPLEYVSFYSVMCAPSCVKISMLHGGTKDTAQHWRIHHRVQWENCAPKIISAQWRKTKGRR